MIVYDTRSPRGRVEHQPSHFSVLDLKSPTGSMPDGETWGTILRSSRSVPRLPARRRGRAK